MRIPVFIHNTYRILAVNNEGCTLFRCSREQLVGQSMLNLVVGPDHKLLADHRLRVMRSRGALKFTQHYVFERCDETQFFAYVRSQELEPGVFWTEVVYVDEN